ncbi:MAG: hypothetical protein RMK52_02075 [Chitinophagales bacterium]|nr:hypothetical protein [Chitinophagales bacterium]MDW8393013.1 hypothetical protein [Chitinophagales bacterium]
MKGLLLLLSALVLLPACRQAYSPKPRGYFKITFPERSYAEYRDSLCPFTFTYPAYGVINRDEVFLDTVPDNPCWLNLTFPALNGNLHLSYKVMKGPADLDRLMLDAHRLTYKHVIKAEYIEESYIRNAHGVGGIWYDVGGNAASAVQFFLTDSNRHFLRGALYFYNIPNADSIAPVLQFLRPDLMKLVESFQWMP